MKKIKWHWKVSSWNKVIMYLSPIAGGELAAFFTNYALPAWAHAVFGIAATIVLYLKMFVKDENKDGIIDHFQE